MELDRGGRHGWLVGEERRMDERRGRAATDSIVACFDARACSEATELRRRGIADVSRTVLEAVERAGIRDATVLELGCGVGGLIIEAVRRGARRATGIDLSRAAVEQAAELARESGLGDRCRFEVGDAATATLHEHDVVVHDKVICCYRDVDRLMTNSIAVAGRLYAFSAPPSSGVRGFVARRIAIPMENVFWRLRRSGFRAFVHDLAAIDRQLRDAGFRRVTTRRTLVWDVAVYERLR